jgi:hypothetical protein
MSCQECERLEKEHADAGDAFDAARERLQAKSGISSKDKYESLRQAALELQERLNSTRTTLEHHIQEHEGERTYQAVTSI